jgi:hypothetical protein
MVREPMISKILEKNTATSLFDLATQIEEPRWISRKNLSYGRGIEGADCNYDFCGHAQMSKENKDLLKSLAPKFDGFKLAEVAINRYRVGGYLGKHKDRHYYRRNLVIALQELKDGLYIDDNNEFIEDIAGQGVLFEGVGPAHSVPPVKNLRYTLIYLYE